MIDFPSLVLSLEKCKTPSAKQILLQDYFQGARNDDKIAALALFTGKFQRRVIALKQLKELAIQLSQLPEWLVEESISVIGDTSEAIAGILERPENEAPVSVAMWMQLFEKLSQSSDTELNKYVTEQWLLQIPNQRYIFNKLLSGSFKSPVSKRTLIKAISAVTGLDVETLALRFSVDWNPLEISWNDLVFSQNSSEDYSTPYPFLIPQFGSEFHEVNWQEYSAEWHYNGLRAQIIKRNDELFIWSKNAELMTNSFPEFIAKTKDFPNGIVMDGILNVIENGAIQPKAKLINRLRRKSISGKQTKDSAVVFIAFDLLEFTGKDLRSLPFESRRKKLVNALKHLNLQQVALAENFQISSPEHLNKMLSQARFQHASGIILKHTHASYASEELEAYLRIKSKPLSLKGVLIYAAQASGPSAFAFGSFTFAVWNNGVLLPVAKAEHGLSEEELKELNIFIKNNIIERFGPVRSVPPTYLFEISFDDIRSSTRHKSGMALVNAQIEKWLVNEPIENASHLEHLKLLIP